MQHWHGSHAKNISCRTASTLLDEAQNTTLTSPKGGPHQRNTIMAVIDNTRSTSVSGGGFSALVNLFAAVSTWNDARQTRKSLNALSTRELEDIGLCRGDIDDVAQGNFRF
jgi:uncharacterized protein YjiS (DUF1127 family)